MAFIIIGFYLVTAIIYGFHSFVSYLREAEIVCVIKKDCEYIKTPWKT
jgi:hypothetical protein